MSFIANDLAVMAGETALLAQHLKQVVQKAEEKAMHITDGATLALEFELKEQQRNVRDIETMIMDLEALADELEQQVAIEEERAGVSDPNHFAYPPIAKAARTRSENLRQSVETLNGQKEQADAQLAAAKEALDGAQHAHERRLEGAVGRSAFELRSAS